MPTLKIVYWFEEDDLFRNRLVIKLWDKKLDFLDWEPEDANLTRDFSGCFNIKDFILLANNLWLEWKKIELEEVEDNEIFSDNYN